MWTFSFQRWVRMEVRQKSLRPLDACANCASFPVRRSCISLRSVPLRLCNLPVFPFSGQQAPFPGGLVARDTRLATHHLLLVPMLEMCPTHLHGVRLINIRLGFVTLLIRTWAGTGLVAKLKVPFRYLSDVTEYKHKTLCFIPCTLQRISAADLQAKCLKSF
jgi:hypothetical protein